MIDRDRLLKRFLSYVCIDTMANPHTDEYPSSAGQFELGRRLTQELSQLGLPATHDTWGIVAATIRGNVADQPVVVLNAHLDTSPETSAQGVRPQVIDAYQGGPIPLGTSGLTIAPDENPELDQLLGKTLVTTDGTTLLGGDDKAGIAIIMQVAETLVTHPAIPHGDVKLLFTCDEEIGRGVEHVDVAALHATVCYTLDGGGLGDIDVETFSADGATVTVRGTNIHPSIAKGRMINALRGMGEFLTRLPRTSLAPEVTEGREGFLHPYEVHGGVDRAVAKVLLRDFDTQNLRQLAERLRQIGEDVEAAVPGCQVDVTIERQYRNLADGLQKEPRAVAFAELAHQRAGIACRRAIIRGGTDGSQLTERGLPTPNLSSGQHNPHSQREFVCLDEMCGACEVVLELLQIWAGQ